MGRQQVVDEGLGAAPEGEGPLLDAGLHHFQEQLGAVASDQGHQRVGIGRFKTEQGVAQEVQGGDGQSEAPQPRQTAGGGRGYGGGQW